MPLETLNIFIFSFICSLMTVGVYASTWDGMIFGRLRAWAEGWKYKAKNPSTYEYFKAQRLNKKFDFLMKPIYGCVICMASVWGTIFFFIGYGYNISPDLQYWPVCVVMQAGLNTLWSGIIFMAFEKNSLEQ